MFVNKDLLRQNTYFYFMQFDYEKTTICCKLLNLIKFIKTSKRFLKENKT